MNYEIQNLTMDVKGQGIFVCVVDTDARGFCRPRGALHPPGGSHAKAHQEVLW